MGRKNAKEKEKIQSLDWWLQRWLCVVARRTVRSGICSHPGKLSFGGTGKEHCLPVGCHCHHLFGAAARRSPAVQHKGAPLPCLPTARHKNLLPRCLEVLSTMVTPHGDDTMCGTKVSHAAQEQRDLEARLRAEARLQRKVSRLKSFSTDISHNADPGSDSLSSSSILQYRRLQKALRVLHASGFTPWRKRQPGRSPWSTLHGGKLPAGVGRSGSYASCHIRPRPPAPHRLPLCLWCQVLKHTSAKSLIKALSECFKGWKAAFWGRLHKQQQFKTYQVCFIHIYTTRRSNAIHSPFTNKRTNEQSHSPLTQWCKYHSEGFNGNLSFFLPWCTHAQIKVSI